MTLFFWCAVIGCGALVLSMLFDGLFDGLDDLFFEGALPVVACVLAVFGGVGMAVDSVIGDDVGAAVLMGIPALLAVAAGAVTRALWRRLRRSMPRNAVPMTPGELVGAEVRVLWWKDGRGEVQALTRGHQATLPARSTDVLKAGTRAWVTDTEEDTLILGRIDPP